MSGCWRRRHAGPSARLGVAGVSGQPQLGDAPPADRAPATIVWISTH
jgi:hypothetical protein